MPLPLLHRREFLRRGATAVAASCLLPGVLRAALAPAKIPRPLFTGIGIAATLERAAELKACGCDYLNESTGTFLVPHLPDSAFEPIRERAAAAPLPVLSCNNFLRDPKLRCTGPEADHPRVLAFAETAFRRLGQVGGEYIAFGSSGARRLPEGWPKEKGDEQFVALLQAMAPLAAQHNIVVALESLQARECNYLTRLGEVVDIVAAVNHPNVRVLADLFHMARMNDTPADLERALSWLSVMEIAEKETRSLPGVKGDDFRPFFHVLAAGGFSGRIAIEADGTREQLATAFATIRRQAAEAGAA
ncbi:MAG TPA: sugar phosphate isomerase/epimerase family protein [Opitutus sp.]|nr:sugar phosphate isomerase/epimerase family protein [Opitutus sp.]